MSLGKRRGQVAASASKSSAQPPPRKWAAWSATFPNFRFTISAHSNLYPVHLRKRSTRPAAWGSLNSTLPPGSCRRFAPSNHIAHPKAPHPPPHKPIPPASPAAIVACSSEAPILRASSAAQLTGRGGISPGLSSMTGSISSNATGAYLAARRQQLRIPPFRRKNVTIFATDDDLSRSVISEQLMLRFKARNDSTSFRAASMATVSAVGPGPKRLKACRPAVRAAPQIMPHWWPYWSSPPANSVAASSSDSSGSSKAWSRTLDSVVAHDPTARKVRTVFSDDILLFLLVMKFPGAYQIKFSLSNKSKPQGKTFWHRTQSATPTHCADRYSRIDLNPGGENVYFTGK